MQLLNYQFSAFAEQNLRSLKEYVKQHSFSSSVHGPHHWLRVQRNARFLVEQRGFATSTTVVPDLEVLDLFAFLHDSCRQSDGHDPEHGLRAAKLAQRLADEGVLTLSSMKLLTLMEACQIHTGAPTTGDTTIDICLDADRLDLLRCGVEIDPDQMASSIGRIIALNIKEHEDFLRQTPHDDILNP